jgi:hypothetical protein
MSRLPIQATRFQRLLEATNTRLLDGLRGSWRRRSLALIALLLGVFLGNNLSSYVLFSVGQRPFAVLGFVTLIEVCVRLRSRWLSDEPSLGWILCDNLRVGFVYAVVLEAFKLGS